MANEYLIPFGVDSAPFFAGLKEMSAQTDNFAENAEKSQEKVREAFKKTSEEGQKFGKVLTPSFQSLFNLTEKLRQLQNEVYTEKDVQKIKVYNQQIDATKNKIYDLTNIGRKGFDDMGKEIVKQEGILQKLQRQAQIYKIAIQEATLPENIAKYNKKLQETNAEILRLSNAGKKGFDEMGREMVKQEGILERLQRQAQIYKAGIQGATLPENVTKYNKKLEETNSQISKLSNTGKAGFDDLGNKIETTTSKTNLLSKGFSFFRQAAYLIPGIGLAGIFNLIGEAIIGVVTALLKGKDAFDAVAEKMNLFNSVQKEANKDASKQITDLKILYSTATDGVTNSTKDRTAAVKALQAEFPETFKNISTETILNGQAKKQYDELSASILATSRARAAKAALDEIEAKRLDILFQKQKIINATTNEKNAATGTVLRDESGVATVSFSKKENEAIIEKRKQAALAEQDILDKRLQSQADFLVKFAGGEKAIAKVVEAADLSKIKKNEDEAQKLRDKRLAEQKAFNDLLAKLVSEKDILDAKSITSDRESELAASDARFKKIKEDAKREVDEAKVNKSQRAKLRIEANKLIQQADIAAGESRIDINKKFDEIELRQQQERDRIRLQGERALAQLANNNQQEEIQRVEQRYAEIREAASKAGLLNASTEVKIRENQQRDIDDINIKYGEKLIKDATDLGVATVNVSKEFAGKTAKAHLEKQIKILEIEENGAEAQLALLIANGKTENDIEVKNAEIIIKNLQSAIDRAKEDLSKENKTIRLRDIIFGQHSDEENEAIDKAISASMQAVSTLTDFIASQYDRQIAKKQELIDADNKAVDELENALQREMQLRDDGLANNVDAIQAELDAKKAMREQDLKDQEELQEKQNAARRAQIVIDSIAQASNLITAASEIFAALAGIPFIGVPLAITTIGLMTGAFIAAKVKAFQAVGDGQKFAEGGYIDGPSHARGGKKYRAEDGRGIELEGGEFVTRKTQSQKYGDLLEAINNDDISGMNDAALRGLLAGMGIHFETEKTKEAIQVGRDRDQLKSFVIFPTDNREELKSIDRNISFLADQEKNRSERWEDESFSYFRQGNKLTKIKK